MKQQFFAKLAELVALAKNFPPSAFDEAAPEETTKHRLIRPLLKSLGYEDAHIVPEFKIVGDQVDYLLKSDRPLLFLEAKSLIDTSLDLFEGHKQQVLGYIRNYRVSPEQAQMERPVAWMVLTNFLQWHFIRVTEERPSFSFKLNELMPRREELWELLARENAEASRIDELYDQSHKADLDKRFLADLKRWRLLIANGFALRNQKRSLEEFTLASQQLLDRFIFCRMLETHRLIDWNKLARSFIGYEEFFGGHSEKTFARYLQESLFNEIKFKFNTELFEQPLLCDELKIDNEALATVIGHEPLHADLAAQCGIAVGQGELFPFRHLYLYDFSKMSQDIMGAVYERFLAHKLFQNGGRIVIEDTDELRKKEGIYYTPQYIVDYIVAHTLGEKIKPILAEALTLLGYKNYKAAAAKIRELAQIKVLDPAMGSGSFLLRAFDTLVKAYAGYNTACRKAKGDRTNGSGMLFDAAGEIAEEIHHLGIRVATENIFGVDLDEKAIEVAKLNLWMRLMVVERDFIRSELQKRGKGSRPLNFLPDLRKNLRRGNSLISDKTIAGDAAFDWEKEFPETMQRGGFDVVIGNPPFVLLQDAFRNETQLAFLRRIFKVASYKVDTYHLFIECGIGLAKPGGFCGMITPANFLTNNYLTDLRRFLIEQSKIEQIVVIDEGVFAGISVDNAVFIVRAHEKSLGNFSILHAHSEETGLRIDSETLISVATALANEHVLFTGELDASLKAILDRVQKDSTALGEIADVNFGKQLRDRKIFENDVITIPVTDRLPPNYKPCYTGQDVIRYYVAPAKLACLDLEESRCGGCWDSKKQNAKNKLLTRQIGRHPEFGLDRRGSQCLNTIFMVNVRDSAFDFRLLLGILNSALLRTYWLNRFYDQRRTFPKIKGTYLEAMPIKVSKAKAEEETSKRIIHFVDQLLNAREQFHQIPVVLQKKILHSQNRTPCNLAHYLQKDYADAVKHEILIDDVQRKGFVHAIRIASAGSQITLSATAATDAQTEPSSLPILRLDFKNEPLRQFIYALWRHFLDENARKKKWTTGKKPEAIYPLLVNTLEPLVYFQQAAGDNVRAIRDLMKAVAAEAGGSDLAAIEAEAEKLDREIDERVYELYGLSPEEIAVVENRSAI